LIHLKNIQAKIRNKILFETDSIPIKKGELMALVGKNGSGKSTLLKAIAGIKTFVSGQISINENTYALQNSPIPTDLVSYIPVKIQPFGAISLMDFILSGKTKGRNFLDVPSKSEASEVFSLLAQFNMQDMSSDAFENLSDGEQKLALIMRSVYRNSEILLLDEPESFLDVGNRKLVFEWLNKLSLEGKTIIFSTHQPDLAKDYVNGFIAIHENKITVLPCVEIKQIMERLL
jgi:iron complex transport system ATP-binding protein